MYRQGDVMSDQRYVEIPGSKTHELPPLLLHCATVSATDLTSVMLEAEDMLASSDAGEEIIEQRKLDLALQLTQQRSEEHTSELQSLRHLVCRLLLEKK